MPATVPDVVYAELSLAMRAGDAPTAVAEALAERGALVIHASGAEATAVIAAKALEAIERPGSLAVTCATNAGADEINQAVRAGRVQAGAVDDTRVAIGMDDVRIGVGDIIMTRANDAAADVSNRQRWVVVAISPAGALQVADGAHRAALSPPWVASHVQLGYATTDYGNQGVTTDASVTWVGDATTAAGLYVGASRGRLANEIHVVAPDLEAATEALVAAMGRDRADRGLEVARARAQAESISVPAPAQRPEADPARWRTEAELASLEILTASQIRGTQQQLDFYTEVPERGPEFARAAEATKRAGADRARERARQCWVKANQLKNVDLPAAIADAQADFVAAADAARIIAAGPGLFNRHARRIEEAQAERVDIARHWDTKALPGPEVSDADAARAGAEHAGAMVGAQITRAEADAIANQRQADEIRKAITDDRQYRAAALERSKAQAKAIAAQLAQIEGHRDELAELAHIRAELSPQHLLAADEARVAHLAAERAAQALEHSRPGLTLRGSSLGRPPGRHGPTQDELYHSRSRSHDGPELGGGRGIEM